MTRLSSANNTIATQRHFPYVLLAFFDFVSGAVRVNSSTRSYTTGGFTYTGLGTLCGISDVEENGDGTPTKLSFSLSGVDTSLITVTLAEAYHRRDVALYLGFLDANGDLADTPYTLWEGYMDVMGITSSDGSSMIALTAENRFIMWNRATNWQYTDAHQKLFDPTDNFFDQVNSLPNKIIVWKDFVVAQQAARPGFTPRGTVAVPRPQIGFPAPPAPPQPVPRAPGGRGVVPGPGSNTNGRGG